MGKRKAAKAAATAQQQPVASNPASGAPARAPGFPAVPCRAAEQVPGNVAATWKPVGHGAGELLLAYEGPLAAAADAVLARTGTLRAGGQPWSETREVRLTRAAPGRFVGVIAVPTGAPVEAIELAFHAGDAWDNGGRAPLGFYEWSAREGRIEAH